MIKFPVWREKSWSKKRATKCPRKSLSEQAGSASPPLRGQGLACSFRRSLSGVQNNYMGRKAVLVKLTLDLSIKKGCLLLTMYQIGVI